MTKYSGGYIVQQMDLLRSGVNAHTSAIENPVSEQALAAINTVQETPWRINSWLLDVISELWSGGTRVAGLPPVDNIPQPPELPDDVWETYTDEEKVIHKRAKARIHSENKQIIGKRDSLLRKLELARTLRDEPVIYFPHSFDFRFRIYPMPMDLNPQSDDIGKSLLMFAEGVELGLPGVYWLKVHAANCGGQDKLALNDRVKWIDDNWQHILRSAEDPVGYLWWADEDKDEPFCFLAACHELAMVDRYGPEHISHLAVQVDGSCNGLQHLSALGRDRIGAEATNVAANAVRQDIYQRVADAASEIVAADVAAGVEEATTWAGRIDRKTVKRAVMTTPYGVTDRGIRDQLVGDKITHKVLGENAEGHQAAALYLTSVIRRSMDATIASASAIMGYLQDVAGALAEHDLPLQWTNAAGCKVSQAYVKLAGKRVNTLYGKFSITWEDRNQGLDGAKQRNGSAPNYIHSQDAAHMALTINFARDVFGIEHFSMIHDSYGCHAAHMPKLNAALRQTFKDMYSVDRLQQFHEEQLAVAEPLGIELPVPPQTGDFDVSEVTESVFFFA